VVSEVTGEHGAGQERSDWYVEYDFVVPQVVLALLPFAALLVIRKLAMGVFGRGGIWGGPG
jgi:hypothetical protein